MEQALTIGGFMSVESELKQFAPIYHTDLKILSGLLSQEIGENPGNYRALTALADTLLMENRPRAALDTARKSVEIKPTVEAYFVLGRAAQSLNMYQEAAKHYEKVQEMDCYNVRAIFNKATCLEKLQVEAQRKLRIRR
jgi:tetratricopeptide (TPR) repeat protein